MARQPEGQAETIGRRLRRLGHERGLSQRELQAKLYRAADLASESVERQPRVAR